MTVRTGAAGAGAVTLVDSSRRDDDMGARSGHAEEQGTRDAARHPCGIGMPAHDSNPLARLTSRGNLWRDGGDDATPCLRHRLAGARQRRAITWTRGDEQVMGAAIGPPAPAPERGRRTRNGRWCAPGSDDRVDGETGSRAVDERGNARRVGMRQDCPCCPDGCVEDDAAHRQQGDSCKRVRVATLTKRLDRLRSHHQARHHRTRIPQRVYPVHGSGIDRTRGVLYGIGIGRAGAAQLPDRPKGQYVDQELVGVERPARRGWSCPVCVGGVIGCRGTRGRCG